MPAAPPSVFSPDLVLTVKSLKSSAGFTLVEMLVAIGILTVIILLSYQMIAGTSGAWVRSTSKMAEGREARVAFNSIVSRLSEATVDSYYGYTWQASAAPTVYAPNAYLRHSELRFISGLSSSVTGTASSPTDAVFFVAPLGIVSDTTDYGHLPSLLNICGYYVQWTNVDPNRPAILPSANLPYRFQLMQFVQPSEQMSLYAATATGYPTYTQITTSPAWQLTALKNSPSGVRPIANNVVALLLLPAMTTTDSTGTLAPNFLYSSEAQSGTPATTSFNRLPPVMRVVMYTIDDASTKRLGTSSTMPNLYVDTGGNPIFTNAAKLYPSGATGDIGDLARFEATLSSRHITFRRFEAAVEFPRQPWNYTN